MSRLLIVDDNEQNLYMLRTLLVGHGYEVVTAADGSEALELARRKPPAIAISDILMPGMDGFALCREWKQDAALHRIPFVFYTATYTDPKDEAFALSLGAERFIIKPAEPDHFLAMIEEVVDASEGNSVRVEGQSPVEGEVYLKEYNEALVRKLEDKMLQLQQANLTLQREIRERRQAEERFRAFFEQAAVGAAQIVTETGRFVRINQKYCDILGYTAEEMQKTTFPEITHPEDLQEDLDNMEKLKKGEIREFSMEKRYFRKDGSIVWVNLTVSPTWIEGEKPQYHIAIVEDITDRKHAEQALRESERTLSTLMSNLPGMAYRCLPDPQWTMKFVSSGCIDLTGYDPSDLIDNRKTSFGETVHPEDRQEVWNQVQAAVEKREPFLIVYRIRTKEGRKKWVWEQGRGIFSDKGDLLFLEGFISDITEQKQAEEERDRLFNLSVDLLSIAGFDGFFKQLNPAWERTLGRPREELLSRPWLDFIHPEDREATVRAAEELRSGKTVIRFENRYQCKDGSYRWLSWNAFAQSAENLIFAVTRDITEIREKTEALRASEANLRYAQEVARLGSWESNIEKDALFPSSEACRIFGLEQGTRLSFETWLALVHPEDRPRVREFWRDAVAREPYDVDYRIIVDGTTKWILGRSHVEFDEQGVARRAFGTVQDITERKKAEEEIRDSREQFRQLSAHLQSSREEERKSLAREIHDELAQSLTALKMDLTWLGGRLGPDQAPLLEKNRSAVELIDGTIDRVTRICRELRPDILDDLGLASALEWLANDFQERTGIQCKLLIDPEAISPDSDRATTVFRIFQETLTNVLRHAKATRVEVGLRASDDALILEVADNGKGISEEDMEKSGSFGIIGMQERASLYQGIVSIEGRPEEGTTVIVGIPLRQQEA